MIILLLLINVIVSLYVIRIKARNPATSWAWLFFMIAIPYFGLLVYFLIGQDSKKMKIFKEKSLNDKKLSETFYTKYPSNIDYFPFDDITKNFLTLNQNNTQNIITHNNELFTYLDGSEKFKELMLTIDSAKTYIHMEYYILRDDKLGNFMLNKLIQKAKEGVEIKLLVDALGTFHKRPLFFEPLRQAGCEVAVFGPLHGTRFNYRNHRKLSIIDGKYGFIGGFNIGDEYIYSKKLGTWRDTHIKIYGDAVKNLELQFMMDWNFCSINKLKIEDKYFPNIIVENGIPIQILSSGPDTQVSTIQHSFLYMISKAKKYIYITTPYFMPDENILTALKIASLSGVEVKILIPSIGDHPFVLGGNLSYCSLLLQCKAKCYMYKPSSGTSFIHSKQIIVDDLYINLGSTNFDYRSLHLNFEINALLIDYTLAIIFKKQFMEDLKSSEEITNAYFENLSTIDNLKHTFAKLISPLL
ncbi:MAG: cardiolipin synthase [Lachnospirales bacterium]